MLTELGVSKGFTIGKRTKKMYVEEYETNRDCKITETISIITLHSGKDVNAHKDAFSYGLFSIASMASHVSQELSNLHEKNVLHNDLKPANILWDPESNIVNIVDYDSAARIPENQDFVLTRHSSDKEYMAPETFTSGAYKFTKSSDVYSLGKSLNNKLRLGKIYLSYPELIIKNQTDKMTAHNPDDRPAIDKCVSTFENISILGNKFISQPENDFIQGLGKSLVSLELYINNHNIKAKIGKSLGQKIGMQSNSQGKFENSLALLNIIVNYASGEPINILDFKTYVEQIIIKDDASQGLFSSKGELSEILNDVLEKIEMEEALLLSRGSQPVL